MQDRFKFRVWDTVGECYCPRSHYILLSDGTLIEEIGGEDVICDSKNIEQCTGLKDKNGKLIYEGDIVKDDEGFVGLVKYDEVCAMFKIEFVYSISNFEDDMSWEFEVIGNIHENPKLLEE